MNAPDNGAEKAAFLLAAAALLFVFHYGLAVSLLAGLLAHTLLHRTFRLIHGERLSTGVARIVAAAGVGLVAAIALTGIILLIVGFARGRVGALPRLFVEVARIIADVREQLVSLGISSPGIEELVDTERLQQAVAEWFRDHAAQLTAAGGEVGKFLVHALVGAAIGFLVFFQQPRPDPDRPLAVAMNERIRRLAASFEAVVLAQVEISALNTLLTGVYLFVALPLFDRALPFSGTLLAVTFLAGLLPVVGNLISNSLIVAISAGVSPWVALGSLIFPDRGPQARVLPERPHRGRPGGGERLGDPARDGGLRGGVRSGRAGAGPDRVRVRQGRAARPRPRLMAAAGRGRRDRSGMIPVSLSIQEVR